MRTRKRHVRCFVMAETDVREGQRRKDPVKRLRVPMSPGPDDALPNPYNALLIESVRSEVDVQTFSYARALFADWDVLHVHSPEALLYSPSSLRRMGKSVAMVAIVLVARVRRRPLVWTVHNETPHERLKRLPAAVFRLWKSSTNLRIHLNEGGLGTG